MTRSADGKLRMPQETAKKYTDSINTSTTVLTASSARSF
jgi:hypothetical protein